MAQPARKPDSKSSIEPKIRPELGVIEGGGEGDGVPQGNLRAAEENAGGFYNPHGDKDAESARSLDSKEESAAANETGFYNPVGERKSTLRRLRGFAADNPRSLLVGGAFVGGGFIVAGVVFLFSLLPLKVEHMINNLRDRFFSGPQIALDLTGEKMLAKYLRHHAIDSYKDCGTTISNKCKVRIVGGTHNPVRNAYRAWADNKLETRLAEQGVEFRYNRSADRWHLRYSGQDIDVGKNGEKIPQYFELDSDNRVRPTIMLALQNETKSKQIFYRYIAGGYVSHRTGIKRYIFFNGTRTRIAEAKEVNKRAAELMFAERVITPRSQTLGIALQCVLTGCDATKTQPTSEADAPGQHGAPESPVDTDARHELIALADTYGAKNLDELASLVDDINKQGVSKYFVTTGLSKGLSKVVAKETAEETAEKIYAKIPIIGWIDLAADLVDGAKQIGPTTRKLGYIVNVYAAIQLYNAYQTYADEMHTGKVDADQVASMTDSLAAATKNTKAESLFKNTANAEESPLYGAIMGGSSAPAASLIGSLLPSAAAVTTDSNGVSTNYKCNDGNPPPKGQLVCNELLVGEGNGTANSISGFLDTNAFGSSLKILAAAWHGTLGKLYDIADGAINIAFGAAQKGLDAGCSTGGFIGGVIGIVPVIGDDLQQIATKITSASTAGYCEVKAVAEKAVPTIAEGTATLLIPNPFDNLGGSRNFELAALGANGEGNEVCQNVLGCKAVSPAEAAKIQQAYLYNQRLEFTQKPMLARIFDTSSRYSTISMLAMAVPMKPHAGLQNGFASVLRNPLGVLASSFSGLFRNAGAADKISEQSASPFGLTPYAYDESDIPDDPEAYWDQHCDEKPDQAYQNDAEFATNSWSKKLSLPENVDPNTGMPKTKSVNPCMLIKAAAVQFAGKYNKGLIPAYDLSEIEGSGGVPQADAPISSVNEAELLKDSSNVQCASGTRDLGTTTGYAEGSAVQIRLCAIPDLPSSGEESRPGSSYYINGADGHAIVNARVSSNFVALVKAAKKQGIPMAAASSFRTMAHQQALCNADIDCRRGVYVGAARPGTSNHQLGVAIDFVMGDRIKYALSRSNCVMAAGRCTAPGDSVWEWLNDNAGNYGINPYTAEFWHWSPTGS